MSTDGISFENRLWSKEVRMATQVGHSLSMLTWALSHINSSENLVSNVSKDIFLVHSRLMCEFLQVRPSNPQRDFSIADFDSNSLAEWPGVTSEERDLLIPLWELASTEVVHFSKMRTPELLESIVPFDFSLENVRALTLTIFSILSRFLLYVQSSTSRGVLELRAEAQRATDLFNGVSTEVSPFLPPL